MRQATRNELERIRTMFAPMFGDANDSGPPPKLVTLKGGLPDTLYAIIGPGRRIDAMPDETVSQFTNCAFDLAGELART